MEKLQVALVRWQQQAIEKGERALVIFEGRDAAGKDGTIKRIIEHLSPRNTRAVSLPKPSDRERCQWYFQRYIDHLPAAGEIVLFNRSWYNRAGVEPVMGFCTKAEHKLFLRQVTTLETMLIEDGVKLIKIWLDISREEQASRLDERRTDPVKALKVSPLDAVAQEKWDDYSGARDEMLMRTSTAVAPWTCVRGDRKKKARPAVIRHLLDQLAPGKLLKGLDPVDPEILFPFDQTALKNGRLAR
ncbi:polyphosphate kinase 2 [Caulobacter ginsengisoli]|uniref:ADP/GDP-polyphosphate phosphotransferase n=2 Tax=Caulobacter ginsengisoli TaxID=400775 RepID=A0ABU0IRB2_9CAUL|nr:polyphosphate kinase 2 [Caulobacter ginsengisoli]